MKPGGPARVRYAPSPTGRFHIGGARTALYNYLLARQTGGQFIIRIEDTDRRRYVAGAEQEILQALSWLGLQWDEGPDIGGPSGPYRQSERGELYREHAERLVAMDRAYYCFCTPERLERVRSDQQRHKLPPRYDGLCRRLTHEEAAGRVERGEAHVVRFKTPHEGQTTAHDVLRGEITVDNADLDDYILLKSDGLPVYHLAAMVDDHAMRITHVLRSSEWLPTFPLHVLIYQALGWQQPAWVHLSVFLNPTGKGKMSKRHAQEAGSGVQSIYALDLKPLGYLPEAVDNWLALMGWSFDDRTELFTLNELVEKFAIERLNPSPAAVNYSKLDHFNGLHIRRLDPADLAGRLVPFFREAGLEVGQAELAPVVPLIQERLRTLDEAVEMAGFLFREGVEPAVGDLVGKDMTARESAHAVSQALAIIVELPDFGAASLEPPMRELAEGLKLKPGQLFGILRMAVTGQPVSPPLFETMQLVGRERVVGRLERAARLLGELAEAQTG
jgi:glutamyl-tRNA synthetase